MTDEQSERNSAKIAGTVKGLTEYPGTVFDRVQAKNGLHGQTLSIGSKIGRTSIKQ